MQPGGLAFCRLDPCCSDPAFERFAKRWFAAARKPIVTPRNKQLIDTVPTQDSYAPHTRGPYMRSLLQADSSGHCPGHSVEGPGGAMHKLDGNL